MKRRWSAPARLRAGITLVASLWAALSWGVIIAAVFVDGSIGARIFCAVVLIPVGVLSARIMVRAQMGFVAIEPDNVRIAGLVRSRCVPLDEVDSFVVEPSGSFSMSQVALKRLKGRRYMLWVTGRGITSVPSKRTRERLATVCDELNDTLAAARASSARLD